MCNKSPLVTIGIPVYNAEKTIYDALKSVLNQSFTDFELIITDDGSTDKTVEIINSFVDSRIVFINDSVNKGISFRLNQQIGLARGKYFVRMDSDDLMFPDRLEKQLYFFELFRDADVVGTSAVIIDENNKVYGLRGCSKNKSSIVNRTSSFIHSTIMGRTEWFRSNMYREDLCGCEDAELWRRTGSNSVFYQIEFPLLFYREPVSFNLHTYLFRIKQVRRMYLDKTYKSNHWYESYIQLLSLYFQTIVATILHYCGLSKWIITRRNHPVDKDYYQAIADRILW